MATYDIIEATNQDALAQASGLSFPLALAFPDISEFRARISSLAEDVCNAPDPETAKEALEALDAGLKDIGSQFKTAAEGVRASMENARTALKERIDQQMQPFVEEVKTQNRPLVDAERARLVEAGLTQDEVKKQLQAFIEDLKQDNEDQLQAKAQELVSLDPDFARFQAIGEILKGQKDRVEAAIDADKAEWPQVLEQVNQERKEIILKDIDERIAQLKAKIEEGARGLSQEQRDAQGFTALLAAIDQARQDLEPALEAALAERDEPGLKQAIETFRQHLSEASANQMCTSALPKLQVAQEEATKALEQLEALRPQTDLVQAAVAAVSNLITEIQRAQDLCASVEPITSQQQVTDLRAALDSTSQGVAQVKEAIEALKAEAEALEAETKP